MESNSNKHGDINLGNIHGNVILNQNQSGGTIANNINTRGNENSTKNKKAKIRIFTCLGGLASTVTILAYFGVFPFNQKDKSITPKNDSIKTTIVEQKINGISNSAATLQRNNYPKQSIKMSTEKEKKVNSGISLVMLVEM
ncbi:hypothetical protein SIO70_23175 [Chitinophaga sancti]|uniref:hypothetical protein n=1 Tax=Chitinophaga sancti TaxID=1004 RepID=UPI002A75C29F|nr:hypothetical protein [Chitinophaga sancti]WPQ61264.1 hypothetical protein SIO70_23175 [Chitinophaga sancti]